MFGDVDVVLVGDYYILKMIGWMFVGWLVDDVGMFELLELMCLYCYWVVCLFEVSGLVCELCCGFWLLV